MLDFEFLAVPPCGVTTDSVTSADCLQIWDDFCGVLLFRVASFAPHLSKVVRHGPRLKDRSSLLISRVDLLHLCKDTHTLRVAVESQDGTSSSDLFVLPSSSISMDDFFTLRQR